MMHVLAKLAPPGPFPRNLKQISPTDAKSTSTCYERGLPGKPHSEGSPKTSTAGFVHRSCQTACLLYFVPEAPLRVCFHRGLILRKGPHDNVLVTTAMVTDNSECDESKMCEQKNPQQLGCRAPSPLMTTQGRKSIS
mmetsp:Transcript_20913/g.44523  ORF Transcript_20913/g.44523 Transcript_20913/m.44523 type:complete len:137 (+) Transcript_20913:119-529(+)